jgi:organic hydroperoxide reductase OsmC/OhrA
MMAKTHRYAVMVKWTGNTGTGTSGYKNYERRHEISAKAGKTEILGSPVPGFRGDATRWNPEELLVASVSACHQLWYLHLCSDAGIIVVDCVDQAEGAMAETADGPGKFEQIVLRPRVTLAPGSDAEKARKLHDVAHAKCFIANSVNFPVRVEGEIAFA